MKYEAGVHHRFEAAGQRFVYSAATAALLGLDEVSSAVLDNFCAEGGAELEPWALANPGEDEQETFKAMVQMGLLRPVGEVPPSTDPLPPMPFPISTLVLNVSSKCNLSCTYCYEYGEDKIEGEARKPGKASSRMTPQLARDSVDFLMEHSAARKDVSITFFGGESLLGFEAIRAATLYANERAAECGKRIGYALTTNATLLSDEVIDFLVEQRFGVNISIDGAKDDHDRHRSFKSGGGSYEVIVPRIRKLLAKNRPGGRPIGARITLTRGADDIARTFEHLVGEIGFDQVGFAPVTSSPGKDWALGDDGMDWILEQFAVLSKDYLDEALAGRAHAFSNLDDLLREIHRGINKAHPCGAGLGLLAVSTDGDLGLCHRFVDSQTHTVGDLESGIDHQKREDFLREGHIDTKTACHSCFARPHCSGGCYHEAYVRYGDAAQPNLHYCSWIRSWTELGLGIYGQLAVENPAFLARFEDGPPAPASQVENAQRAQRISTGEPS